ncbi:hypothetical protein AAT16_13015 [Salinicoccus halodurans]|uniref:Type I restriction modification DNA specificity domain-containing protein n=2 Tax=Salinicoccus halodurans TaxID=407035 RepID=A0ABM5TAL8_9STAP|nr:restriction endonuclease subunit S [Salinicoccus halodurans]AKG75024.1 hypothetical protein AAT16_13015 [Salinicoccus halodurans]
MSKEERRVPELRFKGFFEDWEQRKLKKILKVNSGRDYKHLSNGDVPVYGTGGYMLSVNDNLSNKDGVGIGRKGTINKPQFLRAPFWTVDTLFYLTSLPNNNLLFIYYLAENTNWKKYDESTGVPSLSKKTIESIVKYIPDNNEQIALGTLLNEVDQYISLHLRKINILKNLKQQYLRVMFVENEKNTPEIRFKSFNDVWEQRKLGEVGETFSGLSGKKKADFGHGEARFVTYSNIFGNAISDPNNLDIIEIDNKQNQVQYGDVFFTTSSETPKEVGMSSVWLEDTNNVYLNSFCFGYRPIITFDPYYLAFMLRSPSIRKKLIFLAQGISRYNISKKKVMEIGIPTPSTKEQQKIGSFFKELDDTIELHYSKLEKLNKIKQVYLNKMFI